MVKSNQLSAKKVEHIKEPGYYLDGDGLYLQVKEYTTKACETRISKSWVYRWKRAGRLREMGLGPLRRYSLAEARTRAKAKRYQVDEGLDPIEAARAKRDEEAAKEAERRAQTAKRVTFEEATKRYIAAHEKGWSEKSLDQWRKSLAKHCEPINKLFVDEIDLPHIQNVLHPIWYTRTVTASRVRGRIERILTWATVQKHRQGDNPARWSGHLSELLPPPHKVANKEKQPALPYKELPEFMEWLREREGINTLALEFLILTAVRPGNVQMAAWNEFDLDEAVWAIPGHRRGSNGNRMKGEQPHRVPLCHRAVEILKTLPRIKGENRVFPIPKKEPNALAKSSGRVDPAQGGKLITAHGFRSTFSDWAYEQTDYSAHVIESALAHIVGNVVERAYRRGDLFEKRRRVMEEWSRYCESSPVKDRGKVVSIGTAL
jgi:integrase